MRKFLLIALAAMTACTQSNIETVTTTESNPWSVSNTAKIISSLDNPDLVIETSKTLQVIQGLGTCFNELAWISLQRLCVEDFST